jgi:flagellar hook-length control protein FliK
MKIDINLIASNISSKHDMPKQINKKEDFKKVLNNHELQSRNSSNESVNKKELFKSGDSNKVKAKIKDNLEGATDTSQDTEKPSEEMLQVQQLLQSLSSMLQNLDETSVTENVDSEATSLNSVQLLGEESLISGNMDMLKSKLSEIVALLEKLKESSKLSPEMLDMIQKFTSQDAEVKENFNLIKTQILQRLSEINEGKSLKDGLLKEVTHQSTNTSTEILLKDTVQGSSGNKKDNNFSGNSSSEEKFLKNLIGEDKDEIKISKAVNFMSQFEVVKNVDTSKVQTPNLIIAKNNVEVDVIKAIKFMESNNIKDLTVKMNPKELGEVTIKIVMESGIMKASISAQNKETYNLLQHNIQDISDKLKNLDIKIQSLDINIYEDSTFFNKESNDRNNEGRQNNSKGANALLDDEDMPIINNYDIEENAVNKFV